MVLVEVRKSFDTAIEEFPHQLGDVFMYEGEECRVIEITGIHFVGDKIFMKYIAQKEVEMFDMQSWRSEDDKVLQIHMGQLVQHQLDNYREGSIVWFDEIPYRVTGWFNFFKKEGEDWTIQFTVRPVRVMYEREMTKEEKKEKAKSYLTVVK